MPKLKTKKRSASTVSEEVEPEVARPRKVARGKDVDNTSDGAADDRVDPTSVFIRGLPEGTRDAEIRQWLEANIGPTVTCFVIRGDYGLVKFKEATDARRCLQELSSTDFNGSTLQFEAAKPKRKSAQQRSAPAAASVPKPKAKKAARQNQAEASTPGRGSDRESGLDLRSVLIRGVPEHVKKEALQAWVEERLPGGCGIEQVRRLLGNDSKAGGVSFVAQFRKEHNARRALETLQGAKFEGYPVSTSFRALEMSRQSTKAGRLIVRNLAFGATQKHVRKAFEKLGTLEEVHLPAKPGVDAAAGGSAHRGFGFVQYSDTAIAERALQELNGIKICGRGIAVDWAVDSKLFSSLQHEEEPVRGRVPEEEVRAAASEEEAKGEEDDSEDEEDEEEEDDEDAGEEASAAKEVKRMRELLADGDEDADKPDTPKEAAASKSEAKSSKASAGKDSKEPRRPGYDVEEGRTVFVRNAPFDATEEELRKVFNRFGKVASVKFVKDRTGENAHTGSVFIKFRETAGLDAALAVESDADRKLKELSSVVKRSDRRELTAVDGFGVALRGRRLVLKKAMTPDEVDKAAEDRKPQKGAAAKERSAWMHLLHVGEINENHKDEWLKLSKSEQRQRQASMKERKWRINNPNFAIHPLRLSIRNLPRSIDATKLREAVVKHISQQPFAAAEGEGKKQRLTTAQSLVEKISLVRDTERRTEDNVRRSLGFGFLKLKDHRTAMAVLEHLNDNPQVFGGGKRPIVEFAIEDKRKLRMQEELYQKHAHKLLPGADDKTASKGGKGGKGSGGEKDKTSEKGKGADKGKGKGKGKDGKSADADTNQWRRAFKKKKKPGESRGRKQREKRRAQKAAEAEKAATKEAVDATRAKAREKRAQEAKAEMPKKRKKRFEPDAGPPSKKQQRAARPGELSDDFELRALERFRSGRR